MTIMHGPALRIEFKVAADCQIRFWRGDETQPVLEVFNSEFSQSKLSTLRSEVRQSLIDFRKAIGGDIQVKPSVAFEALKILHDRGRYSLIEMFGNSARNCLPKATELCEELYPKWEKRGSGAGTLKPKLVSVRTSIGDG